MTLAMVCCTINNNNNNNDNTNTTTNNNNHNHRKVASLVQTVTIFSSDVGMDLGINKIMSCACKVHFQKIQKIITYSTWRSLSLPRANVTYLSRKQGGRGLISMEDCIILEELSPVDYLRQRKERLLKSAWRRRNRSEVEHPNDFKRRKHEKTARDYWSQKELHGQYIQCMTEERSGW